MLVHLLLFLLDDAKKKMAEVYVSATMLFNKGGLAVYEK